MCRWPYASSASAVPVPDKVAESFVRPVRSPRCHWRTRHRSPQAAHKAELRKAIASKPEDQVSVALQER